MSRTGPYAGGAQVTQEPNYLLWAEQVNAAGGLSVKGQKRKVELISYDDRSEIETAVRTYEKLMGRDKVELILPPWGSATNFAIAPLANRYGYPLLAPTALSRKLIDMKLPYFFCAAAATRQDDGRPGRHAGRKKSRPLRWSTWTTCSASRTWHALAWPLHGKDIRIVERRATRWA